MCITASFISIGMPEIAEYKFLTISGSPIEVSLAVVGMYDLHYIHLWPVGVPVVNLPTDRILFPYPMGRG